MVMKKGTKEASFRRQLIIEDGRPRLYISTDGEKGQPPEDSDSSRERAESVKKEHRGEPKHEPQMFFGNRIGKLLVPHEGAREDFGALDRQLASTREAVREKLERAQASIRSERGEVVEDEEERHRRFMEERNAAQEDLFRDVVRHHEKFETGIDEQELLPRGAPEDVRGEVHRLIKLLGSEGGYIVCPAHAIQPDTPVENIIALYEAAHA